MTTAPLLSNGVREPVPQPPRPTLVVVVDTEEQFDWNAPFSREATSVSAMRHIGRSQQLCDAVGLAPTYVIDYPIATQREGYEAISEWARGGRCRIGAHLHPWVTPPFDEAVNGPNSFMCNLPPALQRAKMRLLCEAIEENTGGAPRVFKAGRYGISDAALASFTELGLQVDVSINPCISFASEGGPDFSSFDSQPLWIDRDQGVLEVPCTHGFIGWARERGYRVRAAADALRAFKMPGVLSRVGMVNRVMLSPEGNTLQEMKDLTHALINDGLTLFSLTFHSPSVEPGHTPYVRTQSDLQTFLSTIERYFEFFFGELEGQPSTPESFRREVLGRVSTTHV